MTPRDMCYDRPRVCARVPRPKLPCIPCKSVADPDPWTPCNLWLTFPCSPWLLVVVIIADDRLDEPGPPWRRHYGAAAADGLPDDLIQLQIRRGVRRAEVQAQRRRGAWRVPVILRVQRHPRG